MPKRGGGDRPCIHGKNPGKPAGGPTEWPPVVVLGVTELGAVDAAEAVGGRNKLTSPGAALNGEAVGVVPLAAADVAGGAHGLGKGIVLGDALGGNGTGGRALLGVRGELFIDDCGTGKALECCTVALSKNAR